MSQINYCLERTHLYESIANNLEAMIVSDTSQIGKKLPSEQTLANNFGVSRNVIREALKILKERQLVSLHTGEGAYIEKPSRDGVASILDRMIRMDHIDDDHVWAMRRMLELEACRLMVKNGGIHACDELEKINLEMSQCADDPERRQMLDVQFHNTIAKYSGNPLLAIFEESIQSLLRSLIGIALLPSKGNEEGVKSHAEMIEVFRSGNVERSMELMGRHIDESVNNYRLGKEIAGHKREGGEK